MHCSLYSQKRCWSNTRAEWSNLSNLKVKVSGAGVHFCLCSQNQYAPNDRIFQNTGSQFDMPPDKEACFAFHVPQGRTDCPQPAPPRRSQDAASLRVAEVHPETPLENASEVIRPLCSACRSPVPRELQTFLKERAGAQRIDSVSNGSTRNTNDDGHDSTSW